MQHAMTIGANQGQVLEAIFSIAIVFGDRRCMMAFNIAISNCPINPEEVEITDFTGETSSF